MKAKLKRNINFVTFLFNYVIKIKAMEITDILKDETVTNQTSQIFSELLKVFKPIIIVYYPPVFEGNPVSRVKLEVIKNKFDNHFGNVYYIMFIPSSMCDEYAEIKTLFNGARVLEQYLKDYDVV